MLNLKEYENADKKVLIYCRESRDDNMENYERIETQRDLLLKFCERNGYTNIVDVIMHDDMSGTNFARFDDIKYRILNREFDTIIMKDSSRLGRNQIESLKLVEFLAEHHVELIFENEHYDEEFFPLNAWFNEKRAKDDSRKIRRNLRHKMEEGKLLVREHYGYEKIGNQMIINEEVAWVVKKIFNLYLEGYGFRAIASQLNEEDIPTPSQYRNYTNAPVATAWSSQHISRILKNRVYTGCMVSGTSERVNFKSKKTRKKPKCDWIITENTHEPIIDKQTFEKVQQMIKDKGMFAPKSKKPNAFSGLLICGKCGTTMYKIRRKNRPEAFVCGKYIREGKLQIPRDNIVQGCTTHRIRTDEVKKIVENHIYNMLHNEEYQKYIYKTLQDKTFAKNNAMNVLKKLEENLTKTQKVYKQLYEDKLNGNVPDFIYKEKAQELDKKIKILESQIQDISGDIENSEKSEDNIAKIQKKFKTIEKEGVSKELIHDLIDKIIIFDEKEVTQDDKEKYNIDDETFKQLYNDGGIIIVYKYKVQNVFTSWWIRILSSTSKWFDIGKYLNIIKQKLIK